MEISRIMNVPIEQVFDAISLSFRQDYYANTDVEIAEEEIVEGISYIKYFGKNKQNSIKITIEAFERPLHYAVIYSSNQGKQYVSYSLHQLDEAQTEVIYSQKAEPLGIFQKMNTWLMDKIFKASVEKKVSAQLKALEDFAVISSQQVNQR